MRLKNKYDLDVIKSITFGKICDSTKKSLVDSGEGFDSPLLPSPLSCPNCGGVATKNIITDIGTFFECNDCGWNDQ